MVNRKPKVLIVDDEQSVCDLLLNELTERGYTCASTLHGNDALNELAQEEFDVVLLDLRLPDISGMDVLRRMKLNHHNAAVIAITAVDDVDTAVKTMKLGALDYIVKPFDLDEVESCIRAALLTRETASDKQSSLMNAIALGVEAKVDPFCGYSDVITQETVDSARQLGIAEEEIRRWMATKSRPYSDRKQNSRLYRITQARNYGKII